MSFNNDFQPTTLTEEDLKAQFAKKSLFTFNGYLARKGAAKSYTAEKKSAYYFNILGFLSGNLFRIFAAFMTVFLFLKGIFSIAGDMAAFIAGIITFGFLAAIEFRQVNNATHLFERWFFKDTLSRSHIAMAVIFSAITLFLSLAGVGDTVRYLSEKVDPFQFDESNVNPTLFADIQKADADAQEFYTARSWRGKLDTKDASRYNNLKTTADNLRKQYREEVATAKQKAKADHLAATEKKEEKDGDNTFYCIIFLIVTEVLFWYCFYHKEHYEFLAFHEARLKNQIQPPTQSQPVKPNTNPVQYTNGQQIVKN